MATFRAFSVNSEMDSYLDRYKATVGYQNLLKEIEERGITLESQAFDQILACLAYDYCKRTDNKKNVWHEILYLEQQYPFEASITQIVGHEIAEKFLFIFPAYCLDMCLSIINKYGVDYEVRKERIANNSVAFVTICFFYSSREEEKQNGELNSTGRKIWHEIEHDNGIRCGVYGWHTRMNIRRDGILSTFGYRQFGLDRKEPETRTGIRNDMNQLFRSTWEANVARLLNAKGIVWTYEESLLQLNGINYLPDFSLENQTILEVKGRWDTDSLKKVLAFHKECPQYTLLIIDADLYYDLDKLYSNTIPNWEPSSVHLESNIASIVGLGYVKDKKVFQDISIGDKVILRRDRENRIDTNAIQALTNDGRPLGFMSADWATVYAVKMDVGVQYEAIILDIQPKVIKIKISRCNADCIITYDIFNL